MAPQTLTPRATQVSQRHLFPVRDSEAIVGKCSGSFCVQTVAKTIIGSPLHDPLISSDRLRHTRTARRSRKFGLLPRGFYVCPSGDDPISTRLPQTPGSLPAGSPPRAT